MASVLVQYECWFLNKSGKSKSFGGKKLGWSEKKFGLHSSSPSPASFILGDYLISFSLAIKPFLLLLYSWIPCCLDLQGLGFWSGLEPIMFFFNSVQVDWQLLFWLYSYLLLIWYVLEWRVGGGHAWLENLILKKTLSRTWTLT